MSTAAPRELVIYGGGGHAREALDLVRALNAARPTWAVLGVLDDEPARHGQSVGDVTVLGGESWLAARATSAPAVFLGLGANAVRRRVAARLQALGVEFATLVHPSAVVAADATLAPGAMVAAGAVVSVAVQVGAHAHVNVGATVSHDVVLAPFTHVAPGAHVAGNVTVDEGADVGIGASVIQGRRIGAWSVVGAGAAVVRDVPANAVAMGVPARVARVRHDGWQLA